MLQSSHTISPLLSATKINSSAYNNFHGNPAVHTIKLVKSQQQGPAQISLLNTHKMHCATVLLVLVHDGLLKYYITHIDLYSVSLVLY